MDWRKILILTALGQRPAELVIRHGQLVNVNTGEIYPADIAVAGQRVALVGEVPAACVGPDTVELNAQGMYLIPGLIDSHMHTESSGITLTQLARVLLPRGVTTIMYAHEMANVLGVAGMELVLKESRQVPLKIYFETPTSVPWAPRLEMPAVTLDVDDIRQMLAWPESVSLGESDYFDVLRLDEAILEKLEAARALKMPVNGHAAMLSGGALNAVAGAAFNDDHECSSSSEVLEKLRLGMKVILREANLPWIASAVTENSIDTRNLMLCIDDKLVNVLRNEGGVDNTVRVAIANGIDPVTAIQMATINPAQHFRVDFDLGSISPGKLADIVMTPSLEKLDPQIVVADGRVVAREGKFTLELPAYHYPIWAKQSVHLKRPVDSKDFEVRVDITTGHARLRVLKISAGGWEKTWDEQEFPITNGSVVLPEGKTHQLIAVVERHGGDGNIARGIISDLGLQHGAVASSVSHDCHNITVVGTNPLDMAVCVNTLAQTGGGFAAAMDGKVLAKVEFEIAGLISEAPYEEVAEKLDRFEEIIRTQLGFSKEVVFVVFNFIALQSSPFTAAITDRGLINAYSSSVVPLVVNLRPE